MAKFFMLLLMCLCTMDGHVYGVSLAQVSTPVPQKHLHEERAIYQVLDEFIASIRSKDISRAYLTYTGKDFRDATSLEDFTAFIGTYPSLAQNRALNFVSTTYDGDTATVKANASSFSHKDNVAVFHLRYAEGRWRVFGIQMYAVSPAASKS